MYQNEISLPYEISALSAFTVAQPRCYLAGVVNGIAC